jgi:hypothetical protein
MFLVHQLPIVHNIILNILLQSFTYGIGFYLLAKWINPAPEVLDIIHQFFKIKLPSIFRKK